jgi:hypothetical protein
MKTSRIASGVAAHCSRSAAVPRDAGAAATAAAGRCAGCEGLVCPRRGAGAALLGRPLLGGFALQLSEPRLKLGLSVSECLEKRASIPGVILWPYKSDLCAPWAPERRRTDCGAFEAIITPP